MQSLAARSVAAAARRAAAPRSMPVRFGSGGGHGDHHPHYVFDTSTPYNPFGAPLGIFLGVVVGGLAVSGIAFANGMSKGASK